ncbi:MAG: glycosyltransferase family A protein [Bdellovibrionota bacterium]
MIVSPLVSIVIPVYNRLPLLQRALKSLQQQTFQDFEIVIVDDHSTEDVGLAMKEFPVRYLKTVGKGVSAARNTGIRATTSEFVAFLDSDDEWVSSKLEKQMSFLSADFSCSMVHTNEVWIRQGQEVKQNSKHRKLGGRIFSECTNLCIIAPSSVLVRRSLFDRVGIFDESFPVCEDFDLWLRITAEEDIGFLSEALTIKHGGHKDQLSVQYHSMDLWRVRALVKHINNQSLIPSEHAALKQSLKYKCEILLKGFEKHQNFENAEEVRRYFYIVK